MRIVLITLLGLFLALNLVGFLMPKRTEILVEHVVEADVSVERLHALAHDLARWEEWAPSFATSKGHTVEVTLGQQTAGVGGSATLIFDGEFAIMLFIAADEPHRLVTVEARSGLVSSDLEGGEGFRSWDTLTFEQTNDAKVLVRWKRVGSELDLALLRLWDGVVVAPSVRRQLRLGMEALVAAASKDG